MLKIIYPETNTIKAIQNQENLYYWSLCAEAVLRKHGVVSISESHSRENINAFIIATRKLPFQKEIVNSSAMFEGPVDELFLSHMKIVGHSRHCSEIQLFDAEEQFISKLAYPCFRVRKIPSNRKVDSHPYLFESADRFWNNGQINFQIFKHISGRAWKPIAYARIDDGTEKFLVGVSNGRCIVLGIPIFDIICAAHAFPPLDAGYYEHIRGKDLFGAEKWIVNQLISHVLRNGFSVIQAHFWPRGYTSAFTIRHDYDRQISDEDLKTLINYYNERGIKSTWGLLAGKCDTDQAGFILSGGNEINLHTEAASKDGFQEEQNKICSAISHELFGYTAHGGIGAAGFLGDVQYQWAMQSGMLYGELLGRSNRLPHRINTILDGLPKVVRLMVPASHYSLDAGTKPEAHHFETLLKSLPESLNSGEHVVLMNHPDIHRRQLFSLIESLDLSRTWKATFSEVVDWYDAIKFSSKVSFNEDGFFLLFEKPLLIDTEFTLHLVDGRKKNILCPRGLTKKLVSIPEKRGYVMRALYVSDASKINPAIDGLPDIYDKKELAKSIVCFSHTSELMSFPYRFGSIANAYYRHPPNSIDYIILDSSFRVFRNPWTLAFLIQLTNFLKPHGKLLLNYYPEKEAIHKGYFSLGHLQEVFDQDGTVYRDVSMVEFQKNDALSKVVPSLLSWFFEDGVNLLTEYMQIRPNLAHLTINDVQRFCKKMLEPDKIIASITERNLNTQNPNDLADGVKACSYWITGLNYKSALMRHIIRQYFQDDQKLTLVDQGGGPGFLAMELLLNSKLNIVKTVNCDISLVNLLFARRPYSFFQDQISSQMYYWLGPSEEYQYSEQCDIISFIGSLMYIPRDNVRTALDRAWSALKPGGIIVVHENIKTDSYRTHRDYNMMFSIEELEALLGHYSKSIEYYLSTATIKVNREYAGVKSVFRVLKKGHDDGGRTL